MPKHHERGKTYDMGPKVKVLGRNLGAWEATTAAHIERMSGKYPRVFTTSNSDGTWNVVADNGDKP